MKCDTDDIARTRYYDDCNISINNFAAKRN